jgi:hypothetical protein
MPRQFSYEVFIYNPLDKTQFLFHESFESVSAMAFSALVCEYLNLPMTAYVATLSKSDILKSILYI